MDKITELVNKYELDKVDAGCLYNNQELKQNLIKDLKEAINYSQCCETLKDEEIPTFDEFLENFTKGTGSKKQPIYYYRNVWRPERYMYDYYCDKYNL